MHLAPALLLTGIAGLAGAQITNHPFTFFITLSSGSTEISPYCAGNTALTLSNSQSAPAQSFTLQSDGTLLASNGGNAVASVQVDSSCGKLIFGPPGQGTAGFAPSSNSLSFTFNGQQQFCAANGNVYVDLNTAGCEIFNMATTEFFDPGSC